jgi:hypothetical protein
MTVLLVRVARDVVEHIDPVCVRASNLVGYRHRGVVDGLGHAVASG